MGFFSWKTAEGRSISNVHSRRGAFTVYMVLPDDTRFQEDSYEGYGVFGGKDYYEALAEINGQKGRGAGLAIDFAEPPIPDVRRPRFTENPDAKWENLKDPENCPEQGYFY